MDRPSPHKPPDGQKPPRFTSGPRQRESAVERRLRQIEVAGTTQIDLKREAAERRDKKKDA